MGLPELDDIDHLGTTESGMEIYRSTNDAAVSVETTDTGVRMISVSETEQAPTEFNYP